jgi:transposase
VLSEFRARLVAGGAAHHLLDALLAACRERGYLKTRGRQWTDSTHVLGALRVLSRLERAAETLRAALNALAVAAPDWLRAQAPPEWFERYGRRVEDYRLPKGEEARRAYAATVGADGLRLMAALHAPQAPPGLWAQPAVEHLRRAWIGEYVVEGERLRWRNAKQEMPPVPALLESPYEPEARYGTKRQMSWVGYKVHLTEACDDDLPHLVTHVATTVAPEADIEQLAHIHAGLARAALLPGEHLVDAGYVRGRNLVAARDEHRIDLVGPIYDDRQWQARAKQGFDVAHFRVDWDAEVVVCPRGRPSARWSEMPFRGRRMIHVAFSPEDCGPCPARAQCTRARAGARSLTLHPRDEHEAIQAARRRQATDAFAAAYAPRAGVEGTLSQGVRAFGLRQARYRGLRKTHLQHVATAAALNLRRLTAWLAGEPLAATRTSSFAALAPNA